MKTMMMKTTKKIGSAGGSETSRSRQEKPETDGPKFRIVRASVTIRVAYTRAEKAPGRKPASSSLPTSCSTMMA